MILTLGTSLLAGTTDYIPNVDGKSLNGDLVRIPGDLHGSSAILIVGFTRKSGEQSQQWGMELSKTMCADGQPVQWYELPILSDVPWLVRPFVLRAMRSGLTPEIRSHFVPIYANAEAWKQSVQYSAPDDAYIAQINKSGQVEHLWHGAYDKQRLRSKTGVVFCQQMTGGSRQTNSSTSIGTPFSTNIAARTPG
jgi:hypothetical protein